jgi:hypothetical protein
VDPTAATAPSRIERGIASALPEGSALPVTVRLDLRWLKELRFRWEAMNNAWNQWVLGYNPDRQRELLSRFGFSDIDWRGMSALLAAVCTAVLLVVTAAILARRTKVDPAQRAWRRFCARMARLGLPREPWEGPADYATRIAGERPALAAVVTEAATAYAVARYGDATNDTVQLQRLRAATRKLPYRWSIA